MERARHVTRAVCIGAVLLLGKAAASPQSSGPPLSGLPSAPGPHVAQIQALGNNSWLQLSTPAPDPQWGRCTGRSWGARAAYSPSLRAGFYYGEGMHGWWNSTTRRYYDTLWAYDVMANRWICLYPGAHVDNLTLTLNANGFEVDATGQPIPVAQNVHGYEMLAFDTDQRKFAWMSCPGGYDTILDARRRTWGAAKGYRPSNCSPWLYNPATGKFELRPVSGAVPSGGFGDTLIYVPSLKKFWFKKGGQPDPDVWYYDPAANTWTGVRATGPKPPFGIDSTACLDTKRNRIYIGGGSYPVTSGPNALWVYDLATNAWIDPQPTGSPGNSYATAYAFMNYDSVNDVVVLIKYNAPPNGVFVYAPATNTWTQVSSSIPGAITEVNAFYDPNLNVIFAHQALDNREGEMWVYRYKAGGTPPDTQAPTVPMNLQAVAASSSQINLTWTASTDNVGVTGYRVYRGGTQAGTSTSASFSDTGLSASTGYTYTVAAYDAAGNSSAQSSPATATTLSGGGGGAQAVTGLALINADTDLPIAGFDPLNDGAVLNLGTLPTRNLSIAATTSPSPVGSVVFGYDGNAGYHVESAVPYAIAGDASGNYNPWTPAVGSHSLSAMPYTLSSGGGTAGAAVTIGFTVIDDPTTPSTNGGGSAVPTSSSSDDKHRCGATGIEMLIPLLPVWVLRRRRRIL